MHREGRHSQVADHAHRTASPRADAPQPLRTRSNQRRAPRQRGQRLETTGTIRGYRVVLSEELDDDGDASGIEAYIDVRLNAGEDGGDFLHWTRKRPSVLDAVHVTGAYDYLLHVTRQRLRLRRTLRRVIRVKT
ncbi:DNA-binding transcriptional regulator, Lrp family [Quadrisphaera granulorum]|uniref:DNA-binding Lrp family transcriptional regulator n=1 Tax=Quadrisphaera granulorum TaxID=317664 RepID=A0A316AFT8_9ACTN|nr:Lrp/AsnC family transcriptional regulator [Quadrisphaera granulorum]PWJ56219.1 DNA-binding Lrp family transcriptional regulator [Quadrisphaera granulorum]SZE94853.1 DNA-binding transcriptional regulator, Lrp family [Quadrisphaera granulorum]